jgi:hypothetical protein
LYRTQVRGPESLAGAGIAVLFTGAAAYAQTDEIKVYDAEINNPGQFSLELHNNYTPIGRKSADFLGGIVPNHTLNGVPEWAYGVNDWLELGAYAPVYSWTGNRRVYLCRAIFQYRISRDAVATSCWVKVARRVPSEVGLPLGLGMLVDLARSDRAQAKPPLLKATLTSAVHLRRDRTPTGQ